MSQEGDPRRFSRLKQQLRSRLHHQFVLIRFPWLLRASISLCICLLATDACAQSSGLSDLLQLGPALEIPNQTLETQFGSSVIQAGHQSPFEPPQQSGTFAESLSELRPAAEASAEEIQPKVLRNADQPAERLPMIAGGEDFTHPLVRVPHDSPYGFTGPSGILPTEFQTSSHFIPVDDRWRLGQPDSDRYGKGHPIMDDYLGVKGAWWDPYNQNVLKGDFPIIGQHTFLNITGISETLFEARELPIADNAVRGDSQSRCGGVLWRS